MKYNVVVEFDAWANVKVMADTVEEAIELAKDDDFSLPDYEDWEYDGSLTVDEESTRQY